MLGFGLVVFGKLLRDGHKVISAIGTDDSHVWVFDSWSNTFVSVVLQGLHLSDLSHAIVQLYGLGNLEGGISEGNGIHRDSVSKSEVFFRLP